MGGIAEFERGLIRKRTDEGIERARRPGKKFGRPQRLDAGQKRVIADRHGSGATIPELAEEYGVGVGTIWRALQPVEAAPASAFQEARQASEGLQMTQKRPLVRSASTGCIYRSASKRIRGLR